jgi:hypothetical protein
LSQASVRLTTQRLRSGLNEPTLCNRVIISWSTCRTPRAHRAAACRDRHGQQRYDAASETASRHISKAAPRREHPGCRAPPWAPGGILPPHLSKRRSSSRYKSRMRRAIALASSSPVIRIVAAFLPSPPRAGSKPRSSFIPIRTLRRSSGSRREVVGTNIKQTDRRLTEPVLHAAGPRLRGHRLPRTTSEGHNTGPPWVCSTTPVFLGLALHRGRARVLRLDPVRRATRAVV